MVTQRNNLNYNWQAPIMIKKIFLIVMGLLYIFFSFLSLSPRIYGINMDDFAANRNTVKKVLKANRGTIYDIEGNILATNVSSYTVSANLDASITVNPLKPLHVVDKEMTAKVLAPVLNMSSSYILGLLSRDVKSVELGPGGRGITELKKEEIEALELPGIYFIETDKRYYPNGDFASYITGYAKLKETVDEEENSIYNITGELGIELKYNDLLSGIDGYSEYQKDRFGYKIPDTKEIRNNPINGSNIYLTIDSSIQRFLEDAVKTNTAKYNPEWMILTVMDAKTGDILGSASTPSYDPNILNIVNYENPLTTYVFEPGSTMKIYAYMCAIDKGTYRGNDTYHSGQITIGTDVIKDWNTVGWGTISYDKGFEYSSNVAVSNIVSSVINKTDLKNCYDKYGFSSKTGIELPRELNGVTNFRYPVEVAAAGFGQGITTTPVQQLQALSIFANDGKMLNPHIVSKIVDTNTGKITYQREVTISEQLVKQSTVDKMKKLMYNVVNGTDKNTTGTAYYIEGYDIIGKTGTAQIFNNETGKYSTGANDYIYSFAGMFPSDNPEIIIYAAAKKPRVGTSAVLSRATKSVIESIAKYKNIYGTSSMETEIVENVMPIAVNKNTSDIIKQLDNFTSDIVVIGKGDKVIKQYPSANSKILTNEKIILVTNDINATMPSLYGWSRSEASELLELLGLNYTIDGYGYVINQSLIKGQPITSDEVVTITLNRKYGLDVKEE